ncbi:MAG: sigma-70 family RNA polymerase sigma factor [Planctomycetota bacterium]
MVQDREAAAAAPSVEALLARHGAQIRLFITRRTGPAVLKRTTIEDLYQETMTAALAAAEGCHFDNDARFVSWASTTARRVIVESFRTGDGKGAAPLSIRRPGSSGTGVGESSLPHSGPSPSSVAAGHERQATLHERLATLPSHYREVITLYRLEELPLEEVARRMGKTKGATCRILARATRLLRRSLEG